MTVEQLLSECDLVRLTEEKLAACKPFSCGEGDLDEFFAKDCLVNQRKLLGKKVLFRTNNRTGCRFLIVDALNRPDTLHYYEKNGFRYLIADERLEAKYMGIGVGRLPLNTRLMYFDLLKLKVNS